MSARPVVMWAPIRAGKRGEWIIASCARYARRESKAAYLADWLPEYHRKMLKGVRFARVTVTEVEK